jgi:hypothetical protein
LVSLNVDPVIDAGFIASLNVADTLLLIETPVADAAGTVETTVGATSATAVVNVQTVLLTGDVPAKSVTPVVTVAV